MTLWILSFCFFFFSLTFFRPVMDQLRHHFHQGQLQDEHRLILSRLNRLKETLESGLVPDTEEWKSLKHLPAPWGPVFSSALEELRDRGAPILSSLERMIRGLEEENNLLLEAKMRSSQAFGQVLLSVSILPFFSGVLYFLLPGLQDEFEWFISLVLICLLMGVLAFFWMMHLVESARFGNLPAAKRGWILSSKLFYERMISEITCGNPPDLAWNSASVRLGSQHPDLLEVWGVQIWDQLSKDCRMLKTPLEESIFQFGIGIRRSIQIALVEGSGSLDRLESLQRNFLVDLKMKVSRELQLLPNHCLKPLFILILPSAMLLMFGSLALSSLRLFP